MWCIVSKITHIACGPFISEEDALYYAKRNYQPNTWLVREFINPE